MRSNRNLRLGLFVVAGLAAALALGSAVMAAGRPITVELSGADERPGPGDADGTGTASFTFNPGTGEVCFDYAVEGVAPLFAAHIHVAGAESPGPVVIPMAPNADGTGGSGCVTAERTLIQAILRDPSAYYFNVHNADFPPGALRGQLDRTP